jgi:hypothetical protein
LGNIGSSNEIVTLSAADRNTTFTGTIDAYGSIAGFGAYRDAAVFGPAGTDFTLENIGLIEGMAANGADVGILLAAAGTIKNAGTINDGTGIAILGSKSGALYVKNTGKIEAVSSIDNGANYLDGFLKYGVGLYSDIAGRVDNTGTISGDHAGIAFGPSPVSLAAKGTVVNSGLVTSSLGYGIFLYAGGTVENAGTIIGYREGLNISGAARTADVTNTGFIEATGNVFTINGGSSTYQSTAVFAVAPGTIDNGAGGRIEADGGAGIVLFAGSYNSTSKKFIAEAGTILNAGTVTAEYGIVFYGIGGLKNTGKIFGQAIGFEAESSLANAYNSGLITVSDSEFVDRNNAVTYIATALDLQLGGNLTNAATGTIAAPLGVAVTTKGAATVANAGKIMGGDVGVNAVAVATVVNTGFISASGVQFVYAGNTYGADGVTMQKGGSFTNSATGTIIASLANAVVLDGPGMMSNAGTIIGGVLGVFDFADGTLQNSGLIETTGANADGAVDLYEGGEITNTKSGTIIGQVGIQQANGLMDVNNAGLIASTGAGYFAINLAAGGTIINSGIIRASTGAILATDDAATIDNTGTIITSIASYNNGVDLNAGGLVTNAGLMEGGAGIFTQEGGTIINSGRMMVYRTGIYLTGAGTVSNSGLIDVTKSGYNTGINLGGGGLAINTGTIENSSIFLKSGGTAVNDGLVTARNGLYLKAGGTVMNAGTIDATSAGVFVHAGGTVIDTGSIASTGFAAVYFTPGFSNLLVINAAAKITGSVQGGGGILEFAADGSKKGTFSSAENAQFGRFDSFVIDKKAVWDFSGNFAVQGVNLTNNGTIVETGTDQLTIDQSLLGTGVTLLDKKPLTLNGAVAPGETIKFTGTAEALDLGEPQRFAGVVDKFALGDTIDLTGIPAVDIISTHFAGGVLTLSEAPGSLTVTFASPGSFGADVFVLTGVGNGTDITLEKPGMTILSPTVQPQSGNDFELPVPIGTTMTASPDNLTGLTMFVPGDVGIAAAVLHVSPTVLPPITLQA